jgi:RimJ/RimL family protein N-acetyltransferase
MKVLMLNTPSQGVDIEELAQLHHDEFGGTRQFDVRAVTRAVIQCIMDDRRKYINAWIGYDDDDKPIGYIVGTIRPSLYNMADIATQEMWFVVPKHRTGLVAIQLVWHMEKWAKSLGVERIYLQVEHDNNPELVERIIAIIGRLGYTKQGYIAVKHVFNRAKGNSDDRSTHSELVADAAHR